MSDTLSSSSDDEAGHDYPTRYGNKRQKTHNCQANLPVMFAEVHEAEIRWLSPKMSQEQAENLCTSLDLGMYGKEWESLNAQQISKIEGAIQKTASENELVVDEIPYPVKAMYEQAQVSFKDNPQDDMMIRIKDYAKITSEDLRPDGDHYFWICQITAMFVDIKDQEWYFCEWYYLDVDTPLKVVNNEGYKINPGNTGGSGNTEDGNNDFMSRNRIWKANENEWFNCSFKFTTIEKLVKVYHVEAGCLPRLDLINQQDVYWCNQTTSPLFWTHQDLQPTTTKHDSRVLQVLDLFCGCGGTSFLELGSTDKVEIKTLWAVDEKASMARTYQLNHPNVQVYNLRVQELYSICEKIITWEKAFKSRGYCIKRNKDTSQHLSQDLPIKFGDYQQIKKVQIKLKADYYARRSLVDQEDIEFRPCKDDVVLDFLVQIQDEETWMSDRLLASQYPQLFAQWLSVQKAVPVAEEVDVVVGGPPCQGISGLNRHVKVDMNTLLKGSRNGMLVWFYRFIKLLMPSFVLMEQVQSVFLKIQGLYIKTIQWQLLQLQYQCRIGVCSAAGYGCPQTRPRVFLWAAKPGEQLPPFPEPLHHMQKRVPYVGKESKQCVVQFQSEEAEKNAYPPVVMGDIFMDLPNTCNFACRDIGRVKSMGVDSSAYLYWIRRKPENYSGSDRINARGIDRLAIDIDLDDNIEAKITSFGSSYISGVDSKYKTMILSALDKNEINKSLQLVTIEIGQKVLDGLHSNRELLQQIKSDIENKCSDVDQWVSDLRCVPLNYDDYMRICNIPQGAGACFLHMPGVYTNPQTRRSCCGHFHVCHIDSNHTIVTQALKERRQDVEYGEPISQVFQKAGCPSKTALIPGTFTPLAIEAHFRMKNGRVRTYAAPCDDPFASNPHGQRAPFSRIWWGDAISTVFATPNASVSLNFHPVQDRYLCPREVARAQGFPDYYVFDWDPALNPAQNLDTSTQTGKERISTKHVQIGNAVSPVMALHLGRCLAVAAAGDVPPDTYVMSVKGTVYDQAISAAYDQGLSFYFEKGVKSGYAQSISFADKHNISCNSSDE